VKIQKKDSDSKKKKGGVRERDTQRNMIDGKRNGRESKRWSKQKK